MSLTLTFLIPIRRIVKTHTFTDPAQYDTEINVARRFKFLTPRKSKTIKPTTPFDPDQIDTGENIVRHVLYNDNKPN